MSAGPREQTTEAIRAHAWVATTASGKVGHCLCGEYAGRQRGQRPDHSEHVAEAVSLALGLTEEWRARGFMPAAEEASRSASKALDAPLEHRWVSGWSVVGGEPR